MKTASSGYARSCALPVLRTRRRARAAVAIALPVALLLGIASLAVAQAPAPPANSPSVSAPATAATAHPYVVYVAEASRRFGIPEAWIWSVMRVESAGNPAATSHAGAMGLMQVMPGTYAELRLRHGLGPNAYNPRDSILAGAAYLREMHDRYGSAGFLAAYNAGPGRWEDYVSQGRPLPSETVAYMARLEPIVGSSAAPSPTAVAQIDRFAWRRASLFVGLGERTSTSGSAAEPKQEDGSSTAVLNEPTTASSERTATNPLETADALFAVRRPE